MRETIQRIRGRDERGTSLVEVMVGLIILMTALVGLLGAMGVAAQVTVRGRADLQWWAAVQWKADSLVSLGAGNVGDGSDVVHGHAMSWTVSGMNPQRIDLVVDREGRVTSETIQDTVILYVSE